MAEIRRFDCHFHKSNNNIKIAFLSLVSEGPLLRKDMLTF